MTTAVAPGPPPTPAEPTPSDQPRFYRLSIDQFEQMIDQGILTKHEKVELIEGLLVEKMTEDFPHVQATVMTQQSLAAAVPAGWFLATEISVLLVRSEPEPDFMILRGRIQDDTGKPTLDDVALLVEVSDSSLASDRSRAALFAEAGIASYWIANIPERKVEVYSDPAGNEYRSRKDHGMNDEIALVIDGREVARLVVKDLLPPAEAAPQPDAPR